MAKRKNEQPETNLTGGQGDDTLHTGEDTLTANAGDDSIDGASANDSTTPVAIDPSHLKATHHFAGVVADQIDVALTQLRKYLDAAGRVAAGFDWTKFRQLLTSLADFAASFRKDGMTLESLGQVYQIIQTTNKMLAELVQLMRPTIVGGNYSSAYDLGPEFTKIQELERTVMRFALVSGETDTKPELPADLGIEISTLLANVSAKLMKITVQ